MFSICLCKMILELTKQAFAFFCGAACNYFGVKNFAHTDFIQFCERESEL